MSGSSPSRPLRVFVASAAELLTDHLPHGEGLIAYQTFSALAERGHTLVVCARRAALQSAPPFEVVETGSALRWESLEPLAYARRVARIFRERGGPHAFDAVHWLYPDEPLWFVPPRGATFVVGPRLESWPASTCARRPQAGDVFRTLARPGFAAIRSTALSRASSILLATPPAGGALPAGVRPRARVAPIGVDTTVFAPGPMPAVPTILYVGRLDPVKRVRELVEAFAGVRASTGEVRLVLAGDGPEADWIRARSEELGIAEDVVLLGPVSHDATRHLYRSCSLLCLPSAGEPFGMVVLEAMASGRAVVAVDAGGPRWLVEDGVGGLLMSGGSVTELERVLRDALGQPGRLEEMGRRNRERVERELSLTRLVHVLEEEYRSRPEAAFRRAVVGAAS